MKWYEQIWHRMKNPLYRPELKLLFAMFLHVILASILVVIYPSFFTGAVLGLCLSVFLTCAYATLFT
jgi:hypothetical protein